MSDKAKRLAGLLGVTEDANWGSYPKEKIIRKIGETMLFSGGAEDTPKVMVSEYIAPGSLHHRDKTLEIEQNGRYVFLSVETMESIIAWATGK